MGHPDSAADDLVKIIPNIDQNPLMIRAVHGKWGAPLLVLLSIPLLEYLGAFESYWVAFGLLLLTLFGKSPRELSPAMLHIAVWFGAGKLFFTASEKKSYFDFVTWHLDTRGSSLEPSTLWGFRFLSVLLVVGLFLTVKRAVERHAESTINIYILLLVATFAALLSFFGVQFSASTEATTFLGLVAVVFSNMIWNFSWYLRQAGSTLEPARTGFWRFFPFWTLHDLPIQRKNIAQDPLMLAICRLKGLKLLLWCAILKLGTLLSLKAMAHLGIPTIRDLGFAGMNQLKPPPLNIWISLLHNSTLAICTTAIYAGGCVAVARLAGYPLHRPVYRPYLSESFSQFFGRISFYFNDFLVTNFFYPLWAALRPLGFQKNVRLALTILLTVVIGGATVSLTRSLHFFAVGSFPEAIFHTLYRMPYYFLIGIFSATSVLYSQRKKPEGADANGSGFLLVKSFAYLVLYSVATIPVLANPQSRWRDNWLFFLSLFGI